MNNPKIEAYCTSMDNVFMDYISHRCNDEALCKRLGIYLSKMSEELKFPKAFNVELIDGKNDFCGMKVYPDLTCIGDVFNKIDSSSSLNFCNSWVKDINTYVVEIDKNVFDSKIIAFNPSELTAMLLHELGHVAFSSDTAEIIYNSYRINKNELKYGDKTVVRIAQQVFYAIPTLIACGMHIARTGPDGRREEYIADKIFGIDSYKVHLYNAIDKIIRAYGSTLFSSEHDEATKVGNLFKWCNVNIKEMTTRRRFIKNEIIYQSANTHSHSVRKAYVNVMQRLGIGFADRYTSAEIATEQVFADIDSGKLPVSGLLKTIKIVDKPNSAVGVLEQALAHAFSPAMESKNKEKKPEMPSDYDIDNIMIEIDRIQNHYDRMYVLDLIYAKIDQINNYIEYSKSVGSYNIHKAKLKSQLAMLEKCRLAVLNKRIVTTKYKVLVEYPAGYEG